MKFRNLLALVAVSGCLSFVACGGDDNGGGGDTSNCEPNQNFEMVGKPFVTQYCLDCHSENASEQLRATAEGVMFDDEDGIREHGTHVYERVRDETMPPADHPDQPDGDARVKFLDWLDCSGIKNEHVHEH